MQEKYNMLPDLIANKVINNFDIVYTVLGEGIIDCVQVNFLHPELLQNICREISSILGSLKLTITQQRILARLDYLQLADLIKKIAGSCVMDPDRNLVTGHGFKICGLTGVYFNDLNSKITSLKTRRTLHVSSIALFYLIISIPVLATVDVINTLLDLAFDYVPPVHAECINYATHSELNGDPMGRIKKVAFTFCTELARFANKEECLCLLDELRFINNHIVNLFCIPRGIPGFFNKTLTSETDTYKRYENILIHLLLRHDSLASAIKASTLNLPELPPDILQNISFFLETTDLFHLFCTASHNTLCEEIRLFYGRTALPGSVGWRIEGKMIERMLQEDDEAIYAENNMTP